MSLLCLALWLLFSFAEKIKQLHSDLHPSVFIFALLNPIADAARI
jgi:hypothetical protein